MCVDDIPYSVIDERVARELNCIEPLEKSYRVVVEGLGPLEIYAVCRTTKALLEGQGIEVATLFHVARMPRDSEYEALLGRDVIALWRLVYDPLTNSVRSLIGRPVGINWRL